MSKKSPRRPRWPATNNTMRLVCQRIALITPAELQEVMQPLHSAFKAMREGVGTEWQWCLLASAINTAMAVEKQGVVKGLHRDLHAAELALAAIYRRAVDGALHLNEWHATTPLDLELDAIITAINLHTFQIGKLSHGEVIRALDYAQAEVRSSGGRVMSVRDVLEVMEL